LNGVIFVAIVAVDSRDAKTTSALSMASDSIRRGLDWRAFSVVDTYKNERDISISLAAGLAQPFPLSVVYVTFIYVVAITAILWAGLCIYLAIADKD
jgi:hypothetical protein